MRGKGETRLKKYICSKSRLKYIIFLQNKKLKFWNTHRMSHIDKSDDDLNTYKTRISKKVGKFEIISFLVFRTIYIYIMVSIYGTYRLYNRHYKISTQETCQVTSLYCRSFGWKRSDGIITG